MYNPVEYSNWFSLTWFLPSTIKGYHWENFYFLYLIPVLPLLLFIRWGLYFRFRQKFDIALLSGDVRDWRSVGLLRFTPYLFIVLFEIMILIALARPQRINDQISNSSLGIDIMLLLDLSESMQLEDFKPNRLEAAKSVAKDFISQRTEDKIGIVVFAGKAYSLSPLTTDYSLLSTFISDIKPNLIPESGTAIGNAIGVGINRLQESDNRSKVMLLISDGDNTAGTLDPIMAAELAHAYNIKVYTIGIGKDGLIPFENTYIESSLNETTLRKIAESAGGKFFRAPTMASLKEIFRQIDRMEKSEIMETRFREVDDYYQIYLIWGIVFFLSWLLLKNTFLSNALED
jgi:Ca-activated chloride channel family protein